MGGACRCRAERQSAGRGSCGACALCGQRQWAGCLPLCAVVALRCRHDTLYGVVRKYGVVAWWRRRGW